MIYNIFSTCGILLLFGAYIALANDGISKELYYILNFQASYWLAHSAYSRKIWDYFCINLIWCLISFISFV
jgi:hypothetical protein